MKRGLLLDDVDCLTRFINKNAQEGHIEAAKAALEKLEERLNDLSLKLTEKE